MCFSAPVSFTASAGLALIGVACFTQVTHKKQIWLCMSPFFFAFQQLIEGFIWTVLASSNPNLALLSVLQHIYLFFANFFWPVWFPFALMMLEGILWRRKVLFILLLIGLIYSFFVFSSYSNWVVTSNMPVICNQSIQYDFVFQASWSWLALSAYFLNVTLPFFVSSFPLMWLFGVLVGISLPVAEYFYHRACFSVWCFCGAILSSIVFLALYRNKRGN